MQNKLKTLDPIIAIGTTISIALAVILVLVGQDQATSLLIGLVLTTITLLIDIVARMKEGEDKILQAFTIETTLANDPLLFSTIHQIAEDYASVKKLDFESFRLRANDALLECRDVVHGLVEGKMTVDTRSKFTYGRDGIRNAKMSIKAVAYANPAYWRTKYAQSYLESNAEAVARGVDFTRIWIQKQEILDEYRDILQMHKTAGVKVFVITPDEVPSNLLEDYLIADEQIFVKLELTLDGHPKSEHISIDPIEVDRAKHNFTILLRTARSIEEFFDRKTSGN